MDYFLTKKTKLFKLFLLLCLLFICGACTSTEEYTVKTYDKVVIDNPGLSYHRYEDKYMRQTCYYIGDFLYCNPTSISTIDIVLNVKYLKENDEFAEFDIPEENVIENPVSADTPLSLEVVKETACKEDNKNDCINNYYAMAFVPLGYNIPVINK